MEYFYFSRSLPKLLSSRSKNVIDSHPLPYKHTEFGWHVKATINQSPTDIKYSIIVVMLPQARCHICVCICRPGRAPLKRSISKLCEEGKKMEKKKTDWKICVESNFKIKFESGSFNFFTVCVESDSVLKQSGFCWASSNWRKNRSTLKHSKWILFKLARQLSMNLLFEKKNLELWKDPAAATS